MKKRIIASALLLLLTANANASPVEELNNAVTMIKSGRESEGMSIIRALANSDASPSQVKSAAYYMLGAREKNKEQALLYANTAIELDKTASRNFELKATLLYDMKKYNDSAESFTSAITLTPADDRLYSLRGMAFRDAKNFERAIQDLSKAVEMNPNSGLYRMRLGKAYYLSKKYPEAIAELEKALGQLQKQEQAAECGMLLGDSYLSSNNAEQAQKYYSFAYRYTTDPELRTAIQERLKSFEELKKWNY
ncbi:tetratricopeptide repeat protein [Desulfovibrio oxamicus]|uniref:Tetratricopeptide repeat protein n=1 Tax=Nitratidesulfovibrio oxamicus TaxID=32016 RepID=A0ABS0JAR8_9BACT|nr:tetratricopeptide repeat protein [Nitratidesulfovibrio oxamicus]MBG3878833.1 tetratricopeptide repeat protein [Nitratidesulfovibrio oxamicus]